MNYDYLKFNSELYLKLFSDLLNLKLKYKKLSSISDEWFLRIKKIFIKSDYNRSDVIFVTNDDMVYGFGDKIFAILGMKTVVKVSDPMVIEELCGTDIKKVEFGDRFMVALTESNQLYTGGFCLYGRCGNGRDDDTYCRPEKIFIENHLIVDIKCSLQYTLILTDRQQVYTFGSLDENGMNSISTPTLTSFDSEKIISISCGNNHALALTQTGKVYAWGYNHAGELGLKHNYEVFKPKLVEMPNNVWVKQISCGSYHSLLLTTERGIYSFGFNRHGQLGHKNEENLNIPTLIETSSKFTEILAFDSKSFAMNESNRIEFWGQNFVGKRISSPQQTNFESLQDAIIHYTKYPFTITPMIYKNDENNSEKSKRLSKRLMRTLVKGFNDPKNSDFKFKIKREKCDEQNESCPSDDPNNGYDLIYCHKWIIEENCDYLKKMFANIKSVKESNEMEIKGYSYKTFFLFIQYLYTDSIETKDVNLLNDLLLLAIMYSEEELKIRCVSVIKPLMNVENVCYFYSSSISNRSSELEEYCFEFMTKNIKSIIKTKSYSELDPKIAKIFLTKYIEENVNLNHN